MRNKATAIGASAIFLWSLLALCTSSINHIPPYQLLFMTFSVGGLFGVILISRNGFTAFSCFKQPLRTWFIGIAGLFGYHLFYFFALSNAPVVEASLIAYLWPLLLVLFSAFLPGETLRWYHIFGAITGLLGASALIINKEGITFDIDHLPGYISALGCALTWAIYSVVNRTQKDTPTNTVAGFCLATAILGLLCHSTIETWVTPTLNQWLWILVLGLGPMGAAFYAWDYGTKHGDIKTLGILSYSAPLLSTCFLVLAGKSDFSINILVAATMITAGALIASFPAIKKRK